MIRNLSRTAGAALLALAALCALGQERGSGDDVPRRHALIVAVSEYPSLGAPQQLRGPPNDTRLVVESLRGWGFAREDITVLADRVDGATTPTAAAIRTAMAELVRQAADGDFVYVHFAGHGSQQPEIVAAGASSNEQDGDGYDEIFLPRDIGRWVVGQPVENALVDDEIRDFVWTLRNNGAFVWIVFDSCNSGDMVRGVPVDDERERGVPLAALAAPEYRALAAESAGVTTRGRGQAGWGLGDSGGVTLEADAAGYVAFFAAQSRELTTEMLLPRGEGPREHHGLFTFSLMQVLNRHPGITYRQAAQQVLRTYETMNRRKPTPLVAGTDLDAVVLGREGSGVEQYRMTRDAEGLAVDAGTLHDLSPGTILRVVPQPISTSEDTLAFVRVVRAELTRSVVEPLEHAGRPAVAAAQIPPVTFARPFERSLSLSLRVALPAPSAVRAEDEAAAAAIAAIRAQPNQLVEWVPAGEPAELRLAVAANAVWLVPPWGTLCTPRDIGAKEHPQCTSAADITPSVSLAGPDTRAALADSLQRVARTTNLLRVAATAAAPAERLEISLWINGVQRDESEGSRLILELDDDLELRARNTSDTPLDITVLFIDSRWGISLVYPDGADELGRLGSRSNEIVLAEGKINTETVGIERMLLIAVPARPGSVPDPFRFLAQPSLAASNGSGTRGPGSPAGGIRALLERAGFIGGRTRGPTSDSTDAMIWVQAWETR